MELGLGQELEVGIGLELGLSCLGGGSGITANSLVDQKKYCDFYFHLINKIM